MYIEAKVKFQTPPKTEKIVLTYKATGEKSEINSPNDHWRATILFSIKKGINDPTRISNRIKNYLVKKENAIKETILIKKLTQVVIVELEDED
jgi:hypothetical protein